jgi:hypothetical protein
VAEDLFHWNENQMTVIMLDIEVIQQLMEPLTLYPVPSLMKKV